MILFFNDKLQLDEEKKEKKRKREFRDLDLGRVCFEKEQLRQLSVASQVRFLLLQTDKDQIELILSNKSVHANLNEKEAKKV